MSTDKPINTLVLISVLCGMTKAHADNAIQQASGLINPNRDVPIEPVTHAFQGVDINKCTGCGRPSTDLVHKPPYGQELNGE